MILPVNSIWPKYLLNQNNRLLTPAEKKTADQNSHSGEILPLWLEFFVWPANLETRTWISCIQLRPFSKSIRANFKDFMKTNSGENTREMGENTRGASLRCWNCQSTFANASGQTQSLFAFGFHNSVISGCYQLELWISPKKQCARARIQPSGENLTVQKTSQNLFIKF